MAETNPEQLSAAQKLAIQEYVVNTLSKWIKYLGFASAGTLALSLIYVFFVLPGQAVERAKGQIQDDIAAVADVVNQRLTGLLTEAGASQARVEALENDTNQARQQLNTIRSDLAAVNAETLAQASQLINSLREAEQLGDLIERVSTVERRQLCYCLDARYNGESCERDGAWTTYRGDGKTPDRIRIYYCGDDG